MYQPYSGFVNKLTSSKRNLHFVKNRAWASWLKLSCFLVARCSKRAISCNAGRNGHSVFTFSRTQGAAASHGLRAEWFCPLSAFFLAAAHSILPRWTAWLTLDQTKGIFYSRTRLINYRRSSSTTGARIHTDGSFCSASVGPLLGPTSSYRYQAPVPVWPPFSLHCTILHLMRRSWSNQAKYQTIAGVRSLQFQIASQQTSGPWVTCRRPIWRLMQFITKGNSSVPGGWLYLKHPYFRSSRSTALF